MFPTLFLQTLLISTSLIPNVYAQSAFDSITDPSLRAQFALQTLQIWYNAGTGLWDTAGWWNSANVMTMIANFAKLEPDNKPMQKFAGQVFRNTILQAPAKNPQPGVESKRKRAVALGNTTFVLDIELDAGSGYDKARLDGSSEPWTSFPDAWTAEEGQYVDVMSLPAFATAATVSTASTSGSKAGTEKQVFVAAVGAPRPADWLDGFYDDDLWWALGWIGAYDVTGNIEYLQLAEGLFMAVTKAWPSKCGGGGIWWSWKKDYVNAIANELFFSTAAHLANRAENKDFYIDWAERTLKWFQGSGMINKEGTINDGLNDDCKNNGLTTWSYNQGVILGGLVELNLASPNKAYLPLASRIAHAALSALSDDNGVIHDGCEPGCGGDASQFKGIFMRNLQQLHAAAPDDAYAKAIRKNADSLWANNRDEDRGNVLSINWAGPYVEAGNATTHSSAMDALVAAMSLGK